MLAHRPVQIFDHLPGFRVKRFASGHAPNDASGGRLAKDAIEGVRFRFGIGPNLLFA